MSFNLHQLVMGIIPGLKKPVLFSTIRSLILVDKNDVPHAQLMYSRVKLCAYIISYAFPCVSQKPLC